MSTAAPTKVKRVLVTGANKGIGYAICSALLKRHPETYVFLGSRDLGRGEAAVAQLEAQEDGSWKGRVKAVQLDVSDPASLRRAAQDVAAACGGAVPPPLYGLINNAGLVATDVRTVTQTNLYGVKNVVDAFLPLIEPHGGRIVNVSSGAAPMFVARCTQEAIGKLLANPAVTWEEVAAVAQKLIQAEATSPEALEQVSSAEGLCPGGSGEEMYAYGLSKALLNAYNLALAWEHPNLVINACTPGFIETDLTKPMAERNGKTPAEMGMKPPEAGAHAPIKLLMEELSPESRGWFYGSDGLRSPLDKYRSPGDPEYKP